MRRKAVGIMQHRCDRQVFAADRTVNNHLESLYRGERVNCAPIATGAVMVDDECHDPIASAALAAAAFCAANFALNLGRSVGVSSQIPAV